MTLYEYIKAAGRDFDVWDEVFDENITVCYISDNEENIDNYYKFCSNILRYVMFARPVLYSETIVANWYGFFDKNEKVFRDWAKEYWKEGTVPEDKDDFIFDWIIELHGMFGGGLSEESYKDFVENYMPRLN